MIQRDSATILEAGSSLPLALLTCSSPVSVPAIGWRPKTTEFTVGYWMRIRAELRSRQLLDEQSPSAEGTAEVRIESAQNVNCAGKGDYLLALLDFVTPRRIEIARPSRLLRR